MAILLGFVASPRRGNLKEPLSLKQPWVCNRRVSLNESSSARPLLSHLHSREQMADTSDSISPNSTAIVKCLRLGKEKRSQVTKIPNIVTQALV